MLDKRHRKWLCIGPIVTIQNIMTQHSKPIMCEWVTLLCARPGKHEVSNWKYLLDKHISTIQKNVILLVCCFTVCLVLRLIYAIYVVYSNKMRNYGNGRAMRQMQPTGIASSNYPHSLTHADTTTNRNAISATDTRPGVWYIIYKLCVWPPKRKDNSHLWRLRENASVHRNTRIKRAHSPITHTGRPPRKDIARLCRSLRTASDRTN